jgi:hypothetical protein
MSFLKYSSVIVLLGILGMGREVLAKSENAALIVRNTGCYVFDGDGNYGVYAPITQFMDNNGQARLICKAIVPNNTGKAVNYDQDNNPSGAGAFYVCENFLIGTKWKQTISASGVSTTQIDCEKVDN